MSGIVHAVCRRLDAALNFQVQIEAAFDHKSKNVKDLVCHS